MGSFYGGTMCIVKEIISITLLITLIVAGGTSAICYGYKQINEEDKFHQLSPSQMAVTKLAFDAHQTRDVKKNTKTVLYRSSSSDGNSTTTVTITYDPNCETD